MCILVTLVSTYTYRQEKLESNVHFNLLITMMMMMFHVCFCFNYVYICVSCLREDQEMNGTSHTRTLSHKKTLNKKRFR